MINDNDIKTDVHDENVVLLHIPTGISVSGKRKTSKNKLRIELFKKLDYIVNNN